MPKTDRRAVATVRTSVRRVRGEGREMMGRVEHDLRRFVQRARTEVAIDAKAVRRDLAAALKDTLRRLEEYGGEVRKAFETRLAALDAARAKVRGSRGPDGPSPRRVAELERRIDGIERRLAELTEQLQDQLPSGTG
jgi:hypothetical protein